jgi:YVTN family beta-propeller protein
MRDAVRGDRRLGRRLSSLRGSLAVVALMAGSPAAAGLSPQAAHADTGGGQYAYVSNFGDDTVSAIDTADQTVVATIPVGNGPNGIAALPDGSRVYAINYGADSVSVISTATNDVVDTITVGPRPADAAATPDGRFLYVTNSGTNTVTVIDTATDAVVGNVTVGSGPDEMAFTPDGRFAYVADFFEGLAGTVSVIALPPAAPWPPFRSGPIRRVSRSPRTAGTRT